MNSTDRNAIAKALRRISTEEWKGFLGSRAGAEIRQLSDTVAQAFHPDLDHSEIFRRHNLTDVYARWFADDPDTPASGKGTYPWYPASLGRALDADRKARIAARTRALRDAPGLLADLLGYSVMTHPKAGPWIRERLLRKARPRVWESLVDEFNSLGSRKTVPVRAGASQTGVAAARMAVYWHQGGRWAEAFCSAFALPDGVWRRHEVQRSLQEEIVPSEPLPPLHDYQESGYASLRKLLKGRSKGKTALLSMPTGAGKTRVVVEAVCDHLAAAALGSGASGAVLWIAHSQELQMQAWECFREVWQVPPRRADHTSVRRVQPLRLVCLWGGRDPDTIEDLVDGPEVLIASVDQLSSWCETRPDVIARLRGRKLACVVIDEAHGVITNEFRRVLEALGVKRPRGWQPQPAAPLVVGMTATPWRSSEVQDASLRRYFNHLLLTPDQLGPRPVAALQKRGILSKAVHERIDAGEAPELSTRDAEHVKRFRELSPDYLDRLGRRGLRNHEIVDRVLRLGDGCQTLVFACSINHAALLAACLNRRAGPGTAAAVTSNTPRAARSLVIQQFRGGSGPRVLCTVGVLAAGFDAPKVAAVVITRPTMSAALYEQMVGRGLRGPRNGGTRTCQVIDVQDAGLPIGVLSYERVMSRWSTGGSRRLTQGRRRKDG